MPSTYSPDLRIELIANGEQSGTWGSTTNTNLGTLIEDAIAGYVSVSVTSANQALTANNGAADQARNMVVNLTTTTLANFNVYAPPASKFYVVRNSSAYQATIYCSTVIGNTTAAGAGVSVPAGRETVVFSDGVNMYSAIDYVPSLALGTALPATSGGTGQSSYAVGDLVYASTTTALSKLPDVATGNALISGGVGVAPSYGKIGLTTHVSGTLPVANGGTGVTSSTGTGSVVLSTSPSLVTPALGTPSSGDLTNCTFPTLNQNTTGTAAGLSATLVATSGGTGQSSYAVGDILYASTPTTLTKLADVATGNALISGGVGVAPSYGKIGLTTHVSGTLPIANGGTGTTSTTFVNLATNVTGTLPVANGGTGATTSTGTGSVVLANSPTLVTPALGTPSSGTLTNATGLPLTTGVTGVLPIANGGTGTSSTTFANLTTNVTGVLPATNGGTGQSSYAVGDLVYASGTTTLAKLPDVATGNALLSGGVGAPPSYGKIGLTTHVSDVLPVANGGTGLSAVGTTGQVLTSTGSAATWQTPANNVIGVGQTWQTPTRVLGTTYTNSTGRPIMVACSVKAGDTIGAAYVYVDSVNLYIGTTDSCCGVAQMSYFSFSFIVPAGSTYRVTGVSLFSWAELR